MTHPDKTAVGALVKRLRAEEARTIRLFDFVVAERDKREFGPAGFTLLNSIKHAISGRDPVLPDAAAALTAQAAEIANLRATNMELAATIQQQLAETLVENWNASGKGDYHEGIEEGWKAGSEQERYIWTKAIETYFDATAVHDVERYVERIRKGVEGE